MENVILIVACLALLAGMAVFCVSVLQKNQLEKQKIQQRSMDDKDEFLARVSNDIKTPMNVIVGMTAMGMEEIEHPEKVQECLEKIHMASSFLMGILGDLVDVSKIETGKFVLHPKSYSLNLFLEKISSRTKEECKGKKIQFSMSPEDMNLNIMVDPLRFEQLFYNLLNNAVKFTPEGGNISFRICNYATHNNMFSADYVVEDTGIGMSQDFQKFLFEPFTQEIRNMAEKRNGAGLGLAIVRNIVNLMGGNVEVESEIGKGTKVKVHLDIELAYIQPESKNKWIEEEQLKQVLKGKRVLLVEDHPLDVEVSRRILQKQEMEVVVAENGQEALERFLGAGIHAFDLILMDILMPEMDGLMAARRIRKVKRADAQTIPIIAMTASDSPEDVVACKEAGMNVHVAKPVEPKELYQIIFEYLENPM